MSKDLVIKNGFKLTGVNSLDDVNEFILDNQPKFEELAMNIWAKIVATDVARLYDLDCYNSKKSDTNYIADAYASAERDLYTALQKNVSTPLDLEVQLFFQTSTEGDEVYGLYFITNTELMTYFHKIEGVDAFNYVKDHADAHNKVIWDSILKNTGNPTTCMFSYSITKAGPVNVSMNNILRQLPSKGQRASNLANHLVIAEFEKTNTREFKSNEEVWEYFETEEHQIKVQTKTIEVLKKIDSNIRKQIKKSSK